jgi:hypothetical protein
MMPYGCVAFDLPLADSTEQDGIRYAGKLYKSLSAAASAAIRAQVQARRMAVRGAPCTSCTSVGTG